MGFDWGNVTPEQRQAMNKKAAATRARKKREKLAAQATDLDPYDPLALTFPDPEIVVGDIEAEVNVPVADEAPSTAFELFLHSLDLETRDLLSLAELREIFDIQVAAAKAEAKAAKKKAASETAKQAARMEAGLVPMATIEDIEWQRRMKEVFRFKIELPPAGAQGEVSDIGLRIDQKIFLDGYTYPMTRSEIESRRDIVYRAGQHELMFKGQSIRERQWIMGRATSPHIPLNADGSLA